MFLSHLTFLYGKFCFYIYSILIELFDFFIANSLTSLSILNIRTLSNMELRKCFSYSVGWLFVQLMVFLTFYMRFSFMMSSLLIGKLSSCTSSVLYRNLSPVQSHSSRYSPILFFPIRFSVFGFKLRSLINLYLSFVQGNKYGSNCDFLNLPAPFFECAFYFPVCISGFFKKNSGIRMCVDLCLSLCVFFRPISWNSLPDIMLRGNLSWGLTWFPPLGDQEPAEERQEI